MSNLVPTCYCIIVPGSWRKERYRNTEQDGVWGLSLSHGFTFTFSSVADK